MTFTSTLLKAPVVTVFSISVTRILNAPGGTAQPCHLVPLIVDGLTLTSVQLINPFIAPGQPSFIIP